MDKYVTGEIIKRLREEKKMTQSKLAEVLQVSDKAVSKWETGRGYPDITLLEPLASALGISTVELLNGNDVTNRNKASNMLRSSIYVCPVCGNVICSVGEAVVSCCGIVLPPLEAEVADERHEISIEEVEDEYYITFAHPMSKEHYISFVTAAADNGYQLTKLYPEYNAEARVRRSRTKSIYYYCNRHGLFMKRI